MSTVIPAGIFSVMLVVAVIGALVTYNGFWRVGVPMLLVGGVVVFFIGSSEIARARRALDAEREAERQRRRDWCVARIGPGSSWRDSLAVWTLHPPNTPRATCADYVP